MTKQAPTKPGTPDTIGGYLLPVLKALESRGVDAQNLIRQAGIDEEISSDPLARLPFDRLGEGFRLALVGLAVGAAAALGLSRFISSQVYGVSAFDPASYLGGGLLVALVALMACFFPARRAAKTDPMVALRR